MDIFGVDTVKVEKMMAMRKYKMSHYLKYFRFVEAFLLFFFLFPWFSSRIPAAARATGEYFAQFLHILASPKFVFVVGNAIVVTLLTKSGLFGGRFLSGDVYDDFVGSSQHTQTMGDTPVAPVVQEKNATVFEDKPLCVEESTGGSQCYRRSVSEKQVDNREVTRRKLLRRSETEKHTDETDGCVLPRWSYEESYVSVLSNEEFQRTIDAFIAKQIQFRRQESMDPVVQSQPNSD